MIGQDEPQGGGIPIADSVFGRAGNLARFGASPSIFYDAPENEICQEDFANIWKGQPKFLPGERSPTMEQVSHPARLTSRCACIDKRLSPGNRGNQPRRLATARCPRR